MATVYDYLSQLREENPQYKHLSNRSLYKKLEGQDPNLPSWETTSKTGKKPSKQDPDFMNGLFDWTDYGINETSAGFVKSAYNNSITGLAYQLHNGEARFDLSEYDPGIVEDVFSAVLSFSMPLDFASMFVGGFAGRALTSVGSVGLKAKAVDKIVGKKAFTKVFGAKATKQTTQKYLKSAGVKKTSEQARREMAERHINSLVKERGLSPLYVTKAQSIAAGSKMMGATLATFEGVRGGFQAAVDGENVWGGIGKGIAHGGTMGAIAGATGARLNIKHGELLAKYAGDDFLNYTQKAAKIATGLPGQVGAEALVFTAPELKNVIN